MARKKPQGDVQDILNWLDKKISGGAPKKGATARASAVTAGVSRARKKTVSKGSQAGHSFAKKNKQLSDTFIGDPSKGWRDVAATSASTFFPYGKGAKVINKGVKATVKGAKKAKVVKGVAKTAGFVAGPAAASKAIKSTKRKTRKGTR